MDPNTYWLSASGSEVTVATVGAVVNQQQNQQITKSKETELSAMLAQPTMVNLANIFGTATSNNNMLIAPTGVPSLNQLSLPSTTQLPKRTALPLHSQLHTMTGLNPLTVPNQMIQVPSSGQQINGLVNTTVIPSLTFPSTHVAKNFIQQAAAASGLVGGTTTISNQLDISVMTPNQQQGNLAQTSLVPLRPTTSLPQPFHCVQCNKLFESDGQLSYHTFVAHAQLQARPHKCLSCPESFLQEHHLRDHMRAVHLNEDHGGGAPYNCSECQATFGSGGHLNYHIYMAHTLQGPKPQQHICAMCGKSFIKPNLLSAHIRNVHDGQTFPETSTVSTTTDVNSNTISLTASTANLKVHKCTGCDKSFKTASYLKQHTMSVHDKPLKCTECGKGFGRKSDLKRHYRGVHVRDRPHMCKKCGWTFSEVGNLKHHIKAIHTKDKEFRCTFCSKSFALNSYLRTHMSRMHNIVMPTTDVNNNNALATTVPVTEEDLDSCSGIQLAQTIQQSSNTGTMNQMGFVQLALPPQTQVHRCYECGQTFQNTQLLQNHVMASHAQPFWCTVCGEGFSLPSELQVHLQLKHTTNNTGINLNSTIMVPVNAVTSSAPPPMPAISAPEMVSTVAQTTNIETTTATVNNGRCTLCNLSIGKSVKNHICPAVKYRHAAVACAAAYAMAGERPHLCTECGKGFKTATHLKQHVKCVHAQVRPHKCTQCTKSFSRTSDLKRHIKGVHQKLAPRPPNLPLKCGECDAIFQETIQLKRHIYTIHFRGKPGYKCADCQEAFPDESAFENHICHEEDRPHVCSVCSKRFSMATQLRRHLRSAHSKPPDSQEVHKCFDCNHAFGRSVDLERHIQAVHLKEKPHKCNICGKHFGLQGNLNKHVRAVHLLEKPHQCIECGKRFAHIGVLKRHLKDLHFYDKKASVKNKKLAITHQSVSQILPNNDLIQVMTTVQADIDQETNAAVLQIHDNGTSNQIQQQQLQQQQQPQQLQQQQMQSQLQQQQLQTQNQQHQPQQIQSTQAQQHQQPQLQPQQLPQTITVQLGTSGAPLIGTPLSIGNIMLPQNVPRSTSIEPNLIQNNSLPTTPASMQQP